MKIASQSKPFTNVEPLRVPIAEAHPEELQPVHTGKTQYFQPIRSKNLTVSPKIEIFPKMRIEEIKADTLEVNPHVLPEVEKPQKNDIRMKRTRKKSITPGQALRESTM